MKVSEYTEKTRAAMPTELAELMLQETSIWSNDACYGYMIAAMEKAGYARERIIELIHHLHSSFEELGVEDAEAKWQKF